MGLGMMSGDTADREQKSCVRRAASPVLLSHGRPWLLLILDVFMDCYWLLLIGTHCSCWPGAVRFNQSSLLALLLVSKMW